VALSRRTAKLLEKKYGQKKSFKVGSSSQIAKDLQGTKIPTYNKGGKVVKKKGKKVVKKQKTYKKK
jgi:hypothetical protein